MKRLIPVLVAAAVGAAALLRPIPPPTVAASGWSKPAPVDSGRARGTPAPQAVVYVAGEVARPGVYAVRPDARAKDALALAGGPKPGADLVAVNLAAHLRDGDEIVVPVRGAPLAAPAQTSGAARNGAARHGAGRRAHGPRRGRPHRHARADEPPPASQVDINAADAGELATIPGRN